MPVLDRPRCSGYPTLVHAKVLVTLRRGVLDPAGQAVSAGLRQLGFDEVRGVRIGKVLEIELDDLSEEEAKARLAEMSAQLLANPVIEDFEVSLEGTPGDA